MSPHRVDANLDLLVTLHLRGGSITREAFASLAQETEDAREHCDGLEAAGLVYVGQDRVGLTSIGLWVAQWMTDSAPGFVQATAAIE